MSNYDDIVSQANRMHDRVHMSLDNANSYEAKRTLEKAKKFRELAQSHSDPSRVASAARDLSDHFSRLQHSDGGSDKIMSGSEAATFKDNYRKIYDTTRYMH